MALKLYEVIDVYELPKGALLIIEDNTASEFGSFGSIKPTKNK